MGIVIDLIIIAVIALVAFISAKQGFVRTVIGIVGFIVAIVLSFTLSKPIANYTYDKFIEPQVISIAGDKMADSANLTADQIWGELPDFLTENPDNYNVSKESLNEAIKENDTAQDALKSISQTSVKPVVSELLQTFISVILFSLLMIVVKILAKLLNKLFSFSIAGKLNMVLGALVGVLKGIFISVIICEVIMLIINLAGGIWIFKSENISNTILFNLLTKIF